MDRKVMGKTEESWRVFQTGACWPQSAGKLTPGPTEILAGMTWECEEGVWIRAAKSLDSATRCKLPRLSTVIQTGDEVTIPFGTGTVVRMPVMVLHEPPVLGWLTSDARGAGGPLYVTLG